MTPEKIGKYEVLDMIGPGGMGFVYLAHDDGLDRKVAIKVLLPRFAQDPDLAGLFREEARTMAKLEQHPNIVSVYEQGEDEICGPYFVMEYVTGKDLGHRLEREKRIPPAKAFEIVRQVAEALHYAHRRDVVHCDVKPSNVLLREDGTAIVADFGIAKIRGQVCLVNNPVVGTADYAAPETLHRDADFRSDIYSLGVLTFELLTGSLPVAGERVSDVGLKGDQYRTARVGEVLCRALSEPDRRFSTTPEFVDDLSRALTQLPAVDAGKPAVSTRKRPFGYYVAVPMVCLAGAAFALGNINLDRVKEGKGGEATPVVETKVPVPSAAELPKVESQTMLRIEAKGRNATFQAKPNGNKGDLFLGENYVGIEENCIRPMEEAGNELVLATAADGPPASVDRFVGTGFYYKGKSELLRLKHLESAASQARKPITAFGGAERAALACRDWTSYLERMPLVYIKKIDIEAVDDVIEWIKSLGLGKLPDVIQLSETLNRRRSEVKD